MTGPLYKLWLKWFERTWYIFKDTMRFHIFHCYTLDTKIQIWTRTVGRYCTTVDVIDRSLLEQPRGLQLPRASDIYILRTTIGVSYTNVHRNDNIHPRHSCTSSDSTDFMITACSRTIKLWFQLSGDKTLGNWW